MKDAHKNGIIVASVAIIILVVAFYNNIFAQYGYPAPTFRQAPGPAPGPTIVPGIAGTYTMKDIAYNALDISTALTLGTNVDQYFYAYRNGGWVLLGAHGASGTDIEVTEADGGYIYVVCMTHGTQAFILDAATSLAMNSRCVSVQFVDVTGDLVKEFAIQYSMANIPKAASGYPSSTFTGYFFAEDSASTTDGAPSNLSIAQTSVTSYVEWYLTISAVKKALAFWKVQVKINNTDTSIGHVESLNIPGVGNIGANSLKYWFDASYGYWEWSAGTGLLGDCAFLKVPSASSTKFYFTTGIHTVLGAHNITATVTVYELDYAGNTVTDADDVQINENA